MSYFPTGSLKQQNTERLDGIRSYTFFWRNPSLPMWEVSISMWRGFARYTTSSKNHQIDLDKWLLWVTCLPHTTVGGTIIKTTRLLLGLPQLRKLCFEWSQTWHFRQLFTFQVCNQTSSILNSQSDVYIYIFWHSDCNPFRHSLWQPFLHSIWHPIWHSLWHLSGIPFHIYSDIFSGVLPGICHVFLHSIWQYFWHSLWHCVWHSLWHAFAQQPELGGGEGERGRELHFS